MPDVYRRQAVIEAPLEDVWDVVSNPGTHPEWWPDVVRVEVSDEVAEGDPYLRTSRRLGFLDEVDGIWVVDRLDRLKEARFRCTVSGAYVRVGLTPAAADTFVEVETGMLPPNLRWRLAKALSPLYFRRWLTAVVEALPRAVAQRRASGA